MKLTAAQKHANKVARIANRLAAMSPQNRINDVARVFQQLVRIRHADHNGYCSCVTCGKVLPWNHSGMNSGHFISRAKHATVFHFYNCHPQCAACNDHKGGNAARYEEFMLAQYGSEAVNALKIYAEQKRKWTCEELAEKKIQLMEQVRKESERLP